MSNENAGIDIGMRKDLEDIFPNASVNKDLKDMFPDAFSSETDGQPALRSFVDEAFLSAFSREFIAAVDEKRKSMESHWKTALNRGTFSLLEVFLLQSHCAEALSGYAKDYMMLAHGTFPSAEAIR